MQVGDLARLCFPLTYASAGHGTHAGVVQGGEAAFPKRWVLIMKIFKTQRFVKFRFPAPCCRGDGGPPRRCATAAQRLEHLSKKPKAGVADPRMDAWCRLRPRDQSCARGRRGIVEDMCYGIRRA